MNDAWDDRKDSDAHLLAQLAGGDVSALEQLFVRYQQVIYQLALGIVRDPQTAEEILQDCFYRLYRHAGRLDGSAPLLPWLYRVTVNLCYNSRRRHRIWTESINQLAHRLLQPVRGSPEFLAEQRELQHLIHSTIEALSHSHRAVLVLHYLHDYSVQEIATMLEIPEGTVKSRLHHARRLLKERLQRSYGPLASRLLEPL